MAVRPRTFSAGAFDLNVELRDIMAEVNQEAVELYEAIYRTGMEALAEPLTADEERAVLMQITNDQLTRLMAEDPEQATGVMRRARELMGG